MAKPVTKNKIIKLIKEYGSYMTKISLTYKTTKSWVFEDKQIKDFAENLIKRIEEGDPKCTTPG